MLRVFVLATLILPAWKPVLAQDISQIDKIFSSFDDAAKPGCAVGIYFAGKALTRAYGAADLERGVPLSPSSVFYTASTAKQFTAASIWLLVKEGKLSLDDDVRKYIPELPAYEKPITIGNLLYHTSGLRDYTDLLQLAGRGSEEVSTNADILSLTVRQKKLNYPTGTRYQYTNTNYVLLAEVVKRVSGQTLKDFARTRIFEPLGMNSTQFVDDPVKVIPRRALGYLAKGKGEYTLVLNNAVRNGPAGLYTTVEDLGKWNQNFLNPTVGSAALLRDMERPGRLTDGTVTDYASGIMIGQYKGLPVSRHSGHTPGFRAEFLRFPDKDLGVAVLCNNSVESRPERLAEQVADVYLADRLKPNAPAQATPTPGQPQTPIVTPDQLKSSLGDYWSPSTGEVRQLVIRNGQSVYVIDTWSRARLTAVDSTHFRFGRNEIVVAGASPNRTLTLKWADGRVEEYHELTRAKLSPSQLAKYSGRYYSAELDTVYELAPKGSALVLKRRNQEDMELLPTVRDSFSEGSIRIKFSKLKTGQSVFAFSEGDVSDVGFVSDCRQAK